MSPKHRQASESSSVTSDDVHDESYTPASSSRNKARPSLSASAAKKLTVKRPVPVTSKIATAASNPAWEPQAKKASTKNLPSTTERQQGAKDAGQHGTQPQPPSGLGTSKAQVPHGGHPAGTKTGLRDLTQNLTEQLERLGNDDVITKSWNALTVKIIQVSHEVASLQLTSPPLVSEDSIFPFLLGQILQANSANTAYCSALLSNCLWRCMLEHAFDPDCGFWPGSMSRDFQKQYRELQKQHKEGNLDHQLFSQVKSSQGRAIEFLYERLKGNPMDGNEWAAWKLRQRWVDLRDRVMTSLQPLWQIEDEDRMRVEKFLTEIIRLSTRLGRIFIMSKAIFEIGSLEHGFRPPAENATSTPAKQYIVTAPNLTKRGNNEGEFSFPPKVLLDGVEFEF